MLQRCSLYFYRPSWCLYIYAYAIPHALRYPLSSPPPLPLQGCQSSRFHTHTYLYCSSSPNSSHSSIIPATVQTSINLPLPLCSTSTVLYFPTSIPRSVVSFHFSPPFTSLILSLHISLHFTPPSNLHYLHLSYYCILYCTVPSTVQY